MQKPPIPDSKEGRAPIVQQFISLYREKGLKPVPVLHGLSSTTGEPYREDRGCCAIGAWMAGNGGWTGKYYREAFIESFPYALSDNDTWHFTVGFDKAFDRVADDRQHSSYRLSVEIVDALRTEGLIP